MDPVLESVTEKATGPTKPQADKKEQEPQPVPQVTAAVQPASQPNLSSLLPSPTLTQPIPEVKDQPITDKKGSARPRIDWVSHAKTCLAGSCRPKMEKLPKPAVSYKRPDEPTKK